MNLRRIFFILFALGSLLTAGSLALQAPPAQAQVDTGLAEVGQTVKLPSTDPRVIAVRIINIALGVIGIILVALVLYAGFLWMTSGGEADKVDKAKKILTNALIGLAIILSAWAITRFVIERLLQATQEGGGVGGGGSGYTGGLGGGGVGTSFRVKSITPQGDSPLKPRNVEVKVVFTKPVDEASAAAIAVIKDGGTTVGGSIQVDGSLVTFTPSQACPSPNETRKCFDSNSKFNIKVGNTVKSTGGQTVTCGGFAPSCEASFSTSDLVDTQPPQVSLTYPTEGMPIKVNSFEDVLADASDDSGVATVEFFDGASSFAIDGPNASNTPLTYAAKGVWDTAAAALGAHSLSATVFDLDTNSTKSASVSVVVRPEHCFDQEINGGETGLNCGGDPNSPEYCGACSGGACTNNAQCASGFCLGGVCVEKPVIKYVTPLNGRAGTFVSLTGFNFGTSTGVVKFLGNPNDPADDKVAVAPQACVNAGAKTWSNSQAIVAVPDGAASGPVELTNAQSGLADRSDQEPGPAIPPFVVDNSEHPGLCAIQPSAESVGKEVDAIGSGLGQTAGTIIFGSEDYQLQASPWSDTKAHFKIPVVNNGPYQVWAKTAAGTSNGVEFNVLEKALGEAPQLSSIDPLTGPQQEYITLSGKNFGFSVGTVVFTGQTANGPMEAVGDTSFPAACASGFWRDDSIVVKVPGKFKNGEATADGKYQIKVKRSDGKESNSLEFTLDGNLTPKPGICAIQPAVGPEGTVVQLFGDRFGFDKPIVTFSPNKNALVDSSTNQSIKAAVPKDALTGPVAVLAQNAKSNGVNFQVRNCNEAPEICGPPNQFQCCPSGECRAANEACGVVSTKAEFAWQMSTGLIPLAPYVIEECRPDLKPAPTPSPSPWLMRAGGDQAPVDAAIKIRFSQKLEPTTIKASAFKVYACTAQKDDPCETKQETAFLLSHVAENDQQDVVTLKPDQKLAVNTTYLVTVSTAIKGAGETGDFMLERQECGTGPNNSKLGYCFRFKTRATEEPSQIGAVGVTPHSYTFHETGVPTKYEAVPESLNDKCIVINCNLFNWAWQAGDTRGSITNNTGGANNYVMCEQQGEGKAETGNVPVDITATLASTALQGLGLMYVNFLPPQVLEFAPNCQEACTNAAIWAKFSSKLDDKSVTDPNNIVIKKCFNENCYEADIANVLPIVPTNVEVVDDMVKVRVSHANFEPGAFYRVLLRGGPNVIDANKANVGIKGLNGVPMAGTNHPMGFSWTFRVKVGQDAYCKAERVDVRPVEKFEINVDGRQLFTAAPFSKPDTCSANGQELVQSGDVQWSTSDPLVADFFKIAGVKLVATDTGKLALGCSTKCLATGSGGLYGKMAICGNGKIETTDSNFCQTPANQTNWPKTGTTPKGDACTLLAPGAKAGEECEPGINGTDLCDPNSCLFKPVKLTGAGGTCGDGKADIANGEACDFGLTCVGGSGATSSAPVPEYAPCNTPDAKTACANANGICSMFDYRGCSAGCRHLGSQAGKTTCGNSDVLGDGKDCDDGNTTDGDGCSSACLHEGSKPASVMAAVCGNGDLESGETCEAQLINGQPVFPPGCDSTKCLHTGVLGCTLGETQKCCGNGAIDAGEDCDDGNKTDDDGCSRSCLFEGASAYYWEQGHMAPSFCGNGILEKGEQCEITSQATSDVVAKLINYPALYAANPPVAGNAALLPVINKQFAAPPSSVDPTQLAYIVGQKEPDPETGRSSSTLSAVMMEQTGRATYGLQCGNTSEQDCLPNAQNLPRGLDRFGCCRVRPYTTSAYPTTPPSEVCRNVQINVEFNDRMENGSVVNNFRVAQEPDAADNCPAGTEELILAKTDPVQGWWNKAKAWWQAVVAWFTGGPAQAEKWCVGAITGQLQPVGDGKSALKFAFTLDKALPANTWFRAILKGDADLSDNADLNKREGIKSAEGVVRDGDLSWKFKTNNKICALNVVTISDVTGLHQTPPPPEQPGQEHPFLFINPGNMPETRDFEAVALSLENGQATPLSSTSEYGWDWQPWTSSDKDLVYYASGYVLPESSVAHFTTQQAEGGGSQINGSAILTAGLQVVKDTINVPSTVSSTVYGVAQVTVLACENPWPSLQTAPFRDTDTWLKDMFPMVFGQQTAFTVPDPLVQNFSTLYCRDDGQAKNVDDDLPAMRVNPVPRTQTDIDKGILRQYLFTFADAALKQDGIGIRIMQNPQHLSPQEWYAAQGFVGSPRTVKVDSYPALQDGPSIYVAAANQPKKDGPIYSNIYIVSHNPNASQATLRIYDQLVKYLTFNINILGQSNTCHVVQGSQYEASTVYMKQGKEGELVLPTQCEADHQCMALEAGIETYCDANKLKMARDTQRMADYQMVSRKLSATYDNQGKYPQLTGGTFIKGMSNSLWDSWETLGGQIQIKLPDDPVNRFVTCGRCEDGKLCQSDAECAGQATTTCMGGRMVGGSWQADPQIDPKSCWNPANYQYICPRYSDSQFAVSRLYQYRAFAGGTQYELGSEFEVRPMTASKQDWWSPALSEFMYRCANTSTYGQICTDNNGQPSDKLCRKCANPANCKACKLSGADCTSDAAVCKAPDVCQDVPWISGSCRPSGGTFKYADICTNQPYAENGVCGDGVKNTASKVCSKSYKACATDAECQPNGGYCMGELCELGETQSAKCATDPSKPNVLDGHRLQTCIACTHYDTDPKHPQCVPDVKCGNGRIDKHCSLNPAQGCTSNADCPMNTACIKAEACDDGVLNGTYGHCAVGCGGYGGFCGNSQLDAGEVCDLGVNNGKWYPQKNPASCGYDCQGIGAYCGDQVIQPPEEECDGQSEASQQAICQGTAILCSSNADCPTGKICGSPITLAAGQGILGQLGLARLSELFGINPASAAPYQATPGQFKSGSWNLLYQNGTTIQVGSGQTLEYVNAQGQAVKAGTYADCSQLFVEESDGGKRPTQHVRTCKAPGTATACKWDAWSACMPVGVCGDGIKEPNEECDDGSDNGDSKACTKECKKNVCGDGKLNTGVEECDNGVQNGQPTCNADYSSSCLSCSLSCKFMASAGGYCGDGFKNGPEQCDGKDGLKDANDNDITCKMLGYDYADNSTQFLGMEEIKALDTKTDFSVIESGGSSGGIKNILSSTLLKYTGLLYKFGDWQIKATPGTEPKKSTVISGLNVKLTNVGNLMTGIGQINIVPVTPPPAYNPEAAKCLNTCTYGGCKKCSLDPGTGKIQGRVYDIVFQQVVPNARVTLTYKGVKVNEAFTDMNGVFTLDKINTNTACDAYRIVIDMYDDNPCTDKDVAPGQCFRDYTPPWTYPYDIDESKQGGYFPYTSANFTVTSFAAVVNGKDSDNMPHIDIFPRPERGMAYAAVTWNPLALPDKVWFKLHTVLPESSAFTEPTKIVSNNLQQADWDEAGAQTHKCDYSQRPGIINNQGQDWLLPCSRDIFQYQLGFWDTAKFPYARLICLHRAGEKTAGWLDQKANGCPIEGYEQCLKNKGKPATYCKVTSTDQICKDCGVDSTHVENNKFTCPKEPHFADCGNPMTFGPITSLVNFAPLVYGNVDQPVSFYFVAGDGNSGVLKNVLHSADAKFMAYLVYTKLDGTSEIKAAEKPSDSGWAWHIGDLNPKTQTTSVENKLKGADGVQNSVANCFGSATYKNCQKPIAGLAAWSYWFQARGWGDNCVRYPNDGTDSNYEDTPTKWDLKDGNAVCWQDAEKQACTSPYSCGAWSYKAWSWVHY